MKNYQVETGSLYLLFLPGSRKPSPAIAISPIKASKVNLIGSSGGSISFFLDVPVEYSVNPDANRECAVPVYWAGTDIE